MKIRLVNMVNVATIVVCAFIAAVALVFPQSLRSAARFVTAPVFLDSTHASLGTIPLGKPSYYNFTFLNNHWSRLKISGISTSCGCTIAKVVKNTLRPMEKEDLTVAIRPPHVGEAEKIIVINTNYGSQSIGIRFNAIPPSLENTTPGAKHENQ